MKEIIKVRVRARNVKVAECKSDLLAVGVFSDAKRLDKLNGELNRRLSGAIEQIIKLGDFKAKPGSSAVIYSGGKIGAERILLVGLGEKKKATLDTARNAAASAANKAVEMEVKQLSLAIHSAFGGKFGLAKLAQVIAEGVYFGSYRYDEYRTEAENGRLGSLEAEVVDTDLSKMKKLRKAFATGAVIGQAQSYARTLTNRPGNAINPVTLSAEASKMARGLKNVSCSIFNKQKLTEKGMGGLLAVGSGSANEPRFIVLKYSPAGRKAAKLPRIGLVGKAITFDSGGISIKSSRNMEQMKLDKSGGIAVLGTVRAAAELGLGINVIGIIPAAENMPGGTCYRPGDIVTTYSGKTVEVQNTDAEGRMILIDGIQYALEQKCDVIIDIATLTGSCKVALGRYMAGLMSNDDRLVGEVKRASEDSGEKVWNMPCGDEYAKEMKSKIADLKNIGSKWGGACTAAAFLRQFVGDAKWAHLDIAGMDLFEQATEFSTTGSSGFGVRLLTSYLMNLSQKKS
jgi:leucyl aminopeptidase